MTASRALADFDEDRCIGRQDLAKTVNCLTMNELKMDEVEFICEKVSQRNNSHVIW